MEISRQEIIDGLSNNEGVVTFTKKDGSIRNMLCTRNFSVIPKESHPKGDTTRNVSESVVTAWDLEKNAWRSFRVECVTAFRITGA